jgi:hypothetical protein
MRLDWIISVDAVNSKLFFPQVLVTESPAVQVILLFKTFTTDKLIELRRLKKIQKIRDAPDTDFAGYPAGYPVRAGYRISGRILGLITIFLVKYQINL